MCIIKDISRHIVVITKSASNIALKNKEHQYSRVKPILIGRKIK
jgi:hypothetical protein